MVSVGYARVSTRDQNPDAQTDALRAGGCEKIFVEHASGVLAKRPALDDALDYLRDGDTLVVTKLDRERANLDRTLDALHRTVSRDIVPIQLPIGEERGFSGVVDVVRMKAFSFAANDTAQMSEISIPLALAAKASAAHDELVERVAEADEALMETFFTEGTLSQEQLISGLKSSTAAGRLFPLVCSSDRKSTRLNSSHTDISRMPSSA